MVLKKVKNINPVLEKLENDLAKDGIVVPEYQNVDEDYLSLPRSITEITPKELGEYLNAMTQQKIWVRTVIGRTNLVLRDKKLILDTSKAKIFNELPVKMAMREKELYVLLDDELNKIIKNIIYYEEKVNMLNNILTSLEESIFAISREITRRNSDTNDFNRNENVGRMRSGN